MRERLTARLAGRASIGAGGKEFLLDNFGKDVAKQDVALLNARGIVRRHAQTKINNGFKFAAGPAGEGGRVQVHFLGESSSLKHVR